ncbi:MAG TPA: DUF255 domain-containing protein, partial [Phycisphaerae bacterium]|nr:DUF255 domain-containing protein [Phycisphaerae bacterium]
MNTRWITGQAACLLAASLLLMPGLSWAEEGWGTNYDQALAEAKKTGKVVIADFTGSDCCKWCKKLKKEVFDTPEFKKWAADNAILLELDYPSKLVLPKELKAQNERLQKKYGITGFPTILIFNAAGEVIGKTGYLQGGPVAWINNAKNLMTAPKESKASIPKDIPDGLLNMIRKAGRFDRLLLITVSEGSEQGIKVTSALKEDKKLSEIWAGCITAVHVDASSFNRDTEAFWALQSHMELAEDTAIALIDVSEGKCLYKASVGETHEKMVTGIASVIPEEKEYKGQWLEDAEKAKWLARKLNRPILANFTGSDWCGWCKKLKNEVFGMPTFRQWAAENVVLLELDSPRKKA